MSVTKARQGTNEVALKGINGEKDSSNDLLNLQTVYNEVSQSLSFVGIIGIEDTAKKCSDTVIYHLSIADILSVLITGGNKLTGLSIAK